jgi:hypothetical protein
MKRSLQWLFVALIVANLALVTFLCTRHAYERGWTTSLAGNARIISAVADAYFLENPSAQYVQYETLKEWDKSESLKKSEQPGKIYQPVLARGDSEVIIIYEGRYGTLGLKH